MYHLRVFKSSHFRMNLAHILEAGVSACLRGLGRLRERERIFDWLARHPYSSASS